MKNNRKFQRKRELEHSSKITILIAILLLSILPSITLLKAPTTLSYLADKTGTITNVIESISVPEPTETETPETETPETESPEDDPPETFTVTLNYNLKVEEGKSLNDYISTPTPASINVSSGGTYNGLPDSLAYIKLQEKTETEPGTAKLFTGWYTENGILVTSDSNIIEEGDHYLYAHWVECPVNESITALTVTGHPDKDNDGISDSLKLKFTCNSHFERFSIPLTDLMKGAQYKLSYTITSDDATFGSGTTYESAAYGSCIYTNGDVANNFNSNTFFDNTSYKDIIADFNNKNTTEHTGEIIFSVPEDKDTLYWVWDFGLIQDGKPYEYTIENIKLELVAPKLEFNGMGYILGKEIFNEEKGNFEYTSQIISNFKSNNNELSFDFKGKTDVEAIYFPITGLTAGTEYTITLDHTFNGSFITKTNGNGDYLYDYGFGILSEAPTEAYAKMGTYGTWLSGEPHVIKSEKTNEEVTLTFTAPDNGTVYWVWNMSGCKDNTVNDPNNCEIGVKIKEFSAAN